MYPRRDLILLHLESVIKLLQTRWLQNQELFCTCLCFFFFIYLLTEVLSFLRDTLFSRESSIPPSPLVVSSFPEKTKKGHYNSRVVLKSQPKLSLSAALHPPCAEQEFDVYYHTFFTLLEMVCTRTAQSFRLSSFVFIPSEEMKYLGIVETNSFKIVETALKKWKQIDLKKWKQTALCPSQGIGQQIITSKN